MTVEVDGLGAVRKALRSVDMGPAKLKETGKKAADVVAPVARRIAPRRTGRTASTIRTAGQQSGAVIRAGNASLPGTPPVHFGWPGHNIEPNPYLYEALDQRRQEVIDVFTKNINKVIKDAGL